MIRPLQPSDAPALLHLLERSLPFEEISAPLLGEKIWEDPDFDPRTAWVEEQEGVLRGCAMTVQRNQRAYLKFLAVHPEHRNLGLGRDLLQQAEQGLCVQAVRVAESNPNYLTPGVDVRYTVGLLFLEKHGYRKVGETYNLHCDLSADAFAAEASPDGLCVRRASSGDWAEVRAFLRCHFAGWEHEVARMMRNLPVSLHLAWSGDRLVGFAGYDGNNVGHGWFGPMGTDPSCRGLGVGRILLRRCLADLKAQGREHCVIPWVGPYGFYARHSRSRIDRVFWRYEKTLLAQ